MSFEDIKNQAVKEVEALQKSNKPRIFVGTATCGQAAGALAVAEAVEKELERLKIDADVTQVGCIGMCFAEPIIDILKPGHPRVTYGSVNPETVGQLLEDFLVNDNPRPDLAMGTIGDSEEKDIPRLSDLPVMKPQVRLSTRNCGHIDPTNIKEYIASGGYAGFAKALEMTPEDVIEEVKKSGLRGRGGAGFPTGTKWGFMAASKNDKKYIICNADEGDPGAFMDRSLLEGDPHAVLEGMLIGAYAMGADEGYIYCRAEYPLAIDRLETAIEQMTELGLLGKNILGTDFSLELHVKEGAGAFVCGEETALMASIEGKRGMPRSRPPFPAVSGLWGKPTTINNVETWANVSSFFSRGGDWYAQYGTETSKGTKTFAMSGKINRTGLIEVPLGISLGEVINTIGGGIANGKQFKAVQMGGPSGGCLPASLIDMSVDYESLAQAGAIVGSGGMVVADEDTCMVDMARFFLTFVQSESCGKCVPCRVGTRQMLHIMERITHGQGREGDIEELEELCNLIKSTALCALGGTAPNPVLSTLRYFRDEYEAHIREHRCPALACADLISYYIVPDKCQGCGICLRACPVQAIKGDRRMIHIIDQERCTKCGTCFNVCPERFGSITRVSGVEIEPAFDLVPVTAAPPGKAKVAE